MQFENFKNIMHSCPYITKCTRVHTISYTNPVALPGLYFYSIVVMVTSIVCTGSRAVFSLSNHRHWLYQWQWLSLHAITHTVTWQLDNLPGQRKRPKVFPTTDAMVSPIPSARIPEYNASLQPVERKLNEWIWSSQGKTWKIQAWTGISNRAWIFQCFLAVA